MGGDRQRIVDRFQIRLIGRSILEGLGLVEEIHEESGMAVGEPADGADGTGFDGIHEVALVADEHLEAREFLEERLHERKVALGLFHADHGVRVERNERLGGVESDVHTAELGDVVKDDLEGSGGC